MNISGFQRAVPFCCYMSALSIVHACKLPETSHGIYRTTQRQFCCTVSGWQMAKTCLLSKCRHYSHCADACKLPETSNGIFPHSTAVFNELQRAVHFCCYTSVLFTLYMPASCLQHVVARRFIACTLQNCVVPALPVSLHSTKNVFLGR